MTWLLVIVWILGGGLFAFSFWIFGLAAMRMISGRHRQPELARSGHCAAKRPASSSCAARAPLWFPHGATGRRASPNQPANGGRP